MSVIDAINENYDRNILLFIFTATIAVLALIALLVIWTTTSPSWFLLPASWWVGGMMVWGYSKYQRTYMNGR